MIKAYTGTTIQVHSFVGTSLYNELNVLMRALDNSVSQVQTCDPNPTVYLAMGISAVVSQMPSHTPQYFFAVRL